MSKVIRFEEVVLCGVGVDSGDGVGVADRSSSQAGAWSLPENHVRIEVVIFQISPSDILQVRISDNQLFWDHSMTESR